MDKNQSTKLSNYDAYCVTVYLLRRIWMVIVAAATALMLVYTAQSVLMQPTYTSTITFSITARTTLGETYGTIAATSTISEQLSQLMSSDVLRNSVSKELGYDEQDFPATIAVTVPEDSNIILLQVTADSPELAFRTALAITNNYEEYASFVRVAASTRVINGPTIPASPDNAASRTKLLARAAPVGGLLMLAVLLFFALQTDTVQTLSGAHNQLDAKILGIVYHQRKGRGKAADAKRNMLITNPTVSFYYAETIHRIRTQLEHAQHSRGEKVFLVSSCSENEGKSTLAANLALSLAQKHSRVLLVDADLRKPSQYKIFEVTVQPDKDLGTVLTQAFSKEELLGSLQYNQQNNLFTLYASGRKHRPTELLSSETAKTVMRSLRANFDYVIVDSPPMAFFADSEVLGDLCDASVLVVKQDTVPAPQINDVIDTLNACSATFLGCVLNDVRTFRRRSKSYGYDGYGRYGRRYGYGKTTSNSKREETPHAGS